jgi:hypothetical protein
VNQQPVHAPASQAKYVLEFVVHVPALHVYVVVQPPMHAV